MDELAKLYEPTAVQTAAQRIWDQGDYFHADPAAVHPRGAYTIVIPPPNVTAALHLGHALNNTLQDILIRYHRMCGFNTLWMPGTDHAGIATQTVVEKRLLKEQGKRRTEFTREQFVGHVQAWKDEYEARIIGQLKAMGCSCDWARTRFTMDETCARAVRANFFNLFRDGLIFRGKRLVNWDPATQTVLADDEVEHELIKGHFWYLRYPLAEPVKAGGQTIEHITVATTRPETMLGDTAVAMNPADPRAAALVGKRVRLPIVGRLIPIVADEHVVLPNPESEDEKAKFSTGFLKVTPAHDPYDWEIGRRHNLAVINVMAPDGSISNKHGWTDATTPEAQGLLGLDRFEAREAIVEWFRKEKLLEEIRDYSHEVGHSYRSHVPIEPYLSDQWYIAVKKPIEHLAARFGSGLIPGTDVPVNSLAGLALKPLLDGRLRIIPDRYAKTYQTWLENLRDWPISRQLWWGHQIPIWYLPWEGPVAFGPSDSQVVNLDMPFLSPMEKEHIAAHVVRERSDGRIFFAICVEPGHPQIEEQLIIRGAIRDDDVLDTWFSSALWPFSTLGWPEQTPEMKTYYPGNLLCTAREIITLWVSRMVMMGQYCAGDIPFS
ncbi:MAG: class I tRNA ligase family protein, partial [Phycisphaerae bacterium]|nr:class I tRNA ligase family protein [Phycisphaerae bacterium]